MVPELGMFTWLFDHLRRHPEWSADEGVALAGRVGQLTGHTEVGQLHVTHITQQYVCSLNTADYWKYIAN